MLIYNEPQVVVWRDGDMFVFASKDRECKTEERYVINVLSKGAAREIYDYLHKHFGE